MEYKKANRIYDLRWSSRYPQYFYERLRFFQRFETITEEKMEELEGHIQKWMQNKIYKSCQNIKQKYIKTIFYLNEYTIASFDEKAYFLIKAIDPDVTVLQTYEICSTKKEVEENLLQRFHFVDLRLARIEQAYAEKFLQPEKWRFESMPYDQLQNQIQLLERKKKS